MVIEENDELHQSHLLIYEGWYNMYRVLWQVPIASGTGLKGPSTYRYTWWFVITGFFGVKLKQSLEINPFMMIDTLQVDRDNCFTIVLPLLLVHLQAVFQRFIAPTMINPVLRRPLLNVAQRHMQTSSTVSTTFLVCK